MSNVCKVALCAMSASGKEFAVVVFSTAGESWRSRTPEYERKYFMSPGVAISFAVRLWTRIFAYLSARQSESMSPRIRLPTVRTLRLRICGINSFTDAASTVQLSIESV